MNKYIINSIFALCCFTSCSSAAIKPHILAADAVTNPFIKSACKKHNLSVLGTGGKMMRQVEDIFISFIAYGEYEIPEARLHFLSVVVPFVEDIKKSQELKQYMLYPDFPEKAAHVNITYRDATHQQPYPPKIAHITMSNGTIEYSVSDSPMTAYRTIYEETYHEALQKANCVY